MEQFEATGYVLFNTEVKEYLKENGETIDEVNKSMSCGELKDIETEMETLDDPTNWVIKKLEILYTVTDI